MMNCCHVNPIPGLQEEVDDIPDSKFASNIGGQKLLCGWCTAEGQVDLLHPLQEMEGHPH